MNDIPIFSIRPQYVREIVGRRKRVELRKKIPSKSFDRFIIYRTHPEPGFVAVCSVTKVEEQPVPQLWEDAKHCSGVTESEFYKYFSGVKIGFGIYFELMWTIEGDNYLSAGGLDNFRGPQNFCYLGSVAPDIRSNLMQNLARHDPREMRLQTCV